MEYWKKPLGSETSILLHQMGEYVLSLLQLTGTLYLKNPWYGILAKRGTPCQYFKFGFQLLYQWKRGLDSSLEIPNCYILFNVNSIPSPQTILSVNMFNAVDCHKE